MSLYTIHRAMENWTGYIQQLRLAWVNAEHMNLLAASEVLCIYLFFIINLTYRDELLFNTQRYGSLYCAYLTTLLSLCKCRIYESFSSRWSFVYPPLFHNKHDWTDSQKWAFQYTELGKWNHASEIKSFLDSLLWLFDWCIEISFFKIDCSWKTELSFRDETFPK